MSFRCPECDSPIDAWAMPQTSKGRTIGYECGACGEFIGVRNYRNTLSESVTGKGVKRMMREAESRHDPRSKDVRKRK